VAPPAPYPLTKAAGVSPAEGGSSGCPEPVRDVLIVSRVSSITTGRRNALLRSSDGIESTASFHSRRKYPSSRS